ncbi:MAG: hypothetical protein HYX86_01145 [Chloroflexi bacterium]|nr:hypothetical protein [Chloroflexota bacterium]
MKDRMRLLFSALFLIILGSLLVGCEFSFQVGLEPSIDQVVIARSVDEDQRPLEPTSTFGPEDVFYASVIVSNLEAGSQVTGKWYFGDEFIDEATLTITEAGFSGYVGFDLTSDTTWPLGEYRFEVYLDGELAQTASFQVSE